MAIPISVPGGGVVTPPEHFDSSSGAPEESELGAELGPTITERRPVVTENGAAVLEPGLYLIDTTQALWAQAWPVLVELFGKDALRELWIEPSRDWVLATLYISERRVASLAVRVFSVSPDDATLRGIAESMGYSGILEPVGFLEWATTHHPAVMRGAIAAGEAAIDAAGGLKLGGAVALVLAVLLLLRRK